MLVIVSHFVGKLKGKKHFCENVLRYLQKQWLLGLGVEGQRHRFCSKSSCFFFHFCTLTWDPNSNQTGKDYCQFLFVLGSGGERSRSQRAFIKNLLTHFCIVQNPRINSEVASGAICVLQISLGQVTLSAV